MEVNSLLSEIRAEYHKINDMGLIDPVSVYRWCDIALKRFGGLVTVPAEDIVHSRMGQAKLPIGFFDLRYAFRCEVEAIECDEKNRAELQKEFGWIERSERGFKWCSCDECCKEEFCSTVVEKLYLKMGEATVHYNSPQWLKLGKRTMRNKCANDCRNRYIKDSPHEVVINGDTMYCNFDGPIFINYRKSPIGEDGLPYIPDTPLGLLAQYVEAFIKEKLFEGITVNAILPGSGDLYKLFKQEAMVLFPQAMQECRMMDFSLEEFAKGMIIRNRRRMQVYENMFPSLPKTVKYV